MAFKVELFPKRNKNGRWGFVDLYDEVKIDFIYGFASDYSEGLAVVGAWPLVNGVRDESKPLKYGYLDLAGRFAIKPKYDLKPEAFSDGAARVYLTEITGASGSQKKGKFISYINAKGDRLFDQIFEEAYDFKDGAAKVILEHEGRKIPAYINKKGIELFRVSVGEIGEFCEGLAKRRTRLKFGYIDYAGKTVIPMIFGHAGDFHQGRASVGEMGRFGFINRSGKVVIPVDFDEVKDFSEGLAAVRKGDLWAFVDRKGRLAISYRFSNVGSFRNGVARVEVLERFLFVFKKTRQFKINKKGLPVVES